MSRDDCHTYILSNIVIYHHCSIILCYVTYNAIMYLPTMYKLSQTSRHVITYKHVRPQVNHNNIIAITTTIALRFRRGYYTRLFFRDSYTRTFCDGKTNVFCTQYFS